MVIAKYVEKSKSLNKLNEKTVKTTSFLHVHFVHTVLKEEHI
jgi:hypothetical protein